MVKIVEKEKFLEDLYSFWIHAPEMARKAQAGQFLHVLCSDEVFLRRPISICQIEGENLRFVFAVRGRGTRILAQKEVSDTLDIIGPLGRGFDLTKQGLGNSLVIGGGIGVFPLLELAKRLDNPCPVLGFRSKDLVVMQDEFPNVQIVTEGLVTDGLELDGVTSIYACGPLPMLKAVVEMAKENGIFCEVSLEERMACGIGACLTCVCMTDLGVYAPVCKAGPVFNAEEVAL